MDSATPVPAMNCWIAGAAGGVVCQHSSPKIWKRCVAR